MNYKKILNTYYIALAVACALILLNVALTVSGLSPFQLIYPL
jgi:hypothetical protein